MRRLMQSLAIVAAVFGLIAVPAAVAAEPVPIEGTFSSLGQHNLEAEMVGQNLVVRYVTVFSFGIEGSGFLAFANAEVTTMFHPSGALTTRLEISPDESLLIGACGAAAESTIVFIGQSGPADDIVSGSFHTIGGEGPQLAGTFVRLPGGTWTYSGPVVCES